MVALLQGAFRAPTLRLLRPSSSCFGVQDNEYFFHCFNGRKDFLIKHHGSSAKKSDMRRLAPPSPVLCKWHYTQCVLKTVRGYSYGMAQNAL